MSDLFHDRSKQNYYFWDLVRFVAAIAVVDIHTGAYFISVARFAVPFFFITSGFFISRGIDGASRKQYLLKHVKRLLIYYFAWWIIYWPKELFSIFESLENAHQNFFAALGLFLKNYIINFFYASTFQGSWFISASIIGIPLAFGALQKFNNKVQTFIGVVLYLLILVSSNISGVATSTILSHYFSSNYSLSRTALIAIPYLLIGKMIYVHKDKFADVSLVKLVITTVVTIILSFYEQQMYIQLGGQKETDVLLFSGILAFLMVLISLNRRVNSSVTKVPAWFRPLSSYMYPAQFLPIRLSRLHCQNLDCLMRR